MYTINGTTISMTRGDTLIVQVQIYRDGQAYTPENGDAVRFALKQRLNAAGTGFVPAEPLILKDIPIDTMQLRLNPADTKTLAFGSYAYDIEITFANGIVDTFIADAKLILTPEVH